MLMNLMMFLTTQAFSNLQTLAKCFSISVTLQSDLLRSDPAGHWDEQRERSPLIYHLSLEK